MRDLTTIPPVPPASRISYGSDPNQFIDVYSAPQSSRATLMFIHGGFWRAKYDLTHASHLCAALARHGFTVANIEYRRVGDLGGGWPGTFDDSRLALAAIREMFPAQPFIVAGHSAGGHLALRLACEGLPMDGVIAIAPVAVLRDAYTLHLSNDAVVEFLGGNPAECPAIYDEACPSKHSLTSPAIVIHGIDDDVVPISLSRGYVDARIEDNVRLLELPATGHMELIDPESAAYATLAAVLNDLLR
jgi:pimeloyl-ACP methyl ester carboxylesterase